MENFVEIPREKWPQLLDLFERHWPEGAVAYCLLDTQISYPQLSNSATGYDFKVFCPYGDISKGMVATHNRNNYSQLLIQPLGDDIQDIELCLTTTKIVDWTQNLIVPTANSVVIKCLERIKERLGITLMYGSYTKAYKHLLHKESKNLEIIFPPDVFVGPLKIEHIDLVDKTWTYHGKGTREFFENLMNNNLSFVLYKYVNSGNVKVADDETKDTCKKLQYTENAERSEIAKECANANTSLTQKSGQVSEADLKTVPVAWLSIGDFGALTHLFCIEEYRRNGYAELLTKYVINKLLEKGHYTLAYTAENNLGPQKLFKKLGFEDVGHDYWVVVNLPNK